ncbi:spore coat protein CotS [Mycobacterium sp. 852002-51163_SCH5372311]|uniref:TetR/AcrR family transcriptional regulator n=1 Tax=Mycobacterium sp. 852002-51163_SCH5372311 TaxID=1834097 RepID=UPI0007FDDC93|nr:TetR/AcrR family transcriptional regulator [Mycobacterium sp. 852002-51163_SCH5372311]OBF90842.1 spore coat protein CotS [Mycobacterium sp. 852002-51163_SCH5372311]
MARQVRSEVTRRRILDAAIEVFGEVGYAAAAWGTIIERTGMTKGALYHHFDSKESLASAIIEEGSNAMLAAFRNVCGSSSPALENMIHGTFTIAEVLSTDKMARAAERLSGALSGFNDAATRFGTWLVELMTAEARRAAAEGDLRQDVEPTVVSELIVGAVLGMRLLNNSVSDDGPAGGVGGDFAEWVGQVWALLIAGIVAEASVPYFREFLARESLRHARE